MIQDIFIIGATGNIGSELIRQVLEKDVDIAAHKNPTRIVGVASSSTYLYDKNGLKNDEVIKFSKKEIIGKKYDSILEFIDIVSESEVFFVDLTALKEEMLEFHLNVISKTNNSIVTANKNPLVNCNNEEFRLLTKNPRRYAYRCSVMAGAESINKLVDLADLSDEIISVNGCFSGTLGYLTTMLEKEELLSESVKKANKLGYTEPNPAVDLSGDDVARKILILARSAGLKVNYDNIKLSSFVDEKYLKNNSLEELLEELKKVDSEFKNNFIKAKENNKTYRYVGEIDFINNNLEVGLKEVEINSPLGQLKETANKIVIISKTFKKNNSYIVESPGAGREVTAQNIRRDLLSLIKDREISYKK